MKRLKRLMVGALVASAVILPITMATSTATADSVIPHGIRFDSSDVDTSKLDVVPAPKCTWTKTMVFYRDGKTVTQRIQVCVLAASPSTVIG